MTAKESPVPKEKKDLSSDLEEEGTASEFHEDEHADGKIDLFKSFMAVGSLHAKGCSCTSFPSALCTQASSVIHDFLLRAWLIQLNFSGKSKGGNEFWSSVMVFEGETRWFE